MRAYRAYSRSMGPHEGASLVFANTAKEARKLAYPDLYPDFVADWTDLAIKWIRDTENVLPLADQEKLAADEPHVISIPMICIMCGLWGCGLDADGNCGCCGEDPGPGLKGLFKEWDALQHQR